MVENLGNGGFGGGAGCDCPPDELRFLKIPGDGTTGLGISFKMLGGRVVEGVSFEELGFEAYKKFPVSRV